MAVEQSSYSDDLQSAIDEDSSDANAEDSTSDSGILVSHAIDPELIKLTSDGSSTIISFRADHLNDDVCLAAYRDQVFQLIAEPNCKKLQFDLSNIKLLPSGMLGLMASLRKRGFEVDLLNPSDEIREVLQVMKMDSVFGLRQCES